MVGSSKAGVEERSDLLQCCCRGSLCFSSTLLPWFSVFQLHVAAVVLCVSAPCCYRGSLCFSSMLLPWFSVFQLRTAEKFHCGVENPDFDVDGHVR